MRIEASARQSLGAMVEGDALRTLLAALRRVVKVAPIIEKAKPDEIPRNSAASGAGSKYGRTPSGNLLRQSRTIASERVVIVDGERRVIGEAPRLID